MRFRIKFNRTGRHRMLPMDYQYYISAWIYKVLDKADPEFSDFLHTRGYVSEGKQFKLFCYSPLDFGRPRLWKEKVLFEILQDELSLDVSFLLAEAAEKFIIGLFNSQELYLGDRFNGLDLVVKQVERLTDPVILNSMTYKATSPVVIGFRDESKYPQYIGPEKGGYADFLRRNVMSKYNAVNGKDGLAEDFKFDFTFTGTLKSKLVTIKSNTPEESKIKGFVYTFTLSCPQEIHKLILATGLGEKNSIGFGWVEVN